MGEKRRLRGREVAVRRGDVTKDELGAAAGIPVFLQHGFGGRKSNI